MDAFRITGGRPLRGTIRVAGSKNAVLPQLAATLMTDAPCRIRNVPVLRDVQTQAKILNTLGVETHQAGHEITTQVVDAYNSTAPYELVKTMRAGVCVLGPLIGRRGEAVVSLPGGCVIGERPIDLHLRGLEELGASVRIEHGYVRAKAPSGGLRGAAIYLGGTFGSSVTATANVMSAAVLARGRTIIECAACEPEVVDLAAMLNAMGARIEGAGSPRIEIQGVRRLHGTTWTVIPDRIETATFAVLAALTGSELTVAGCQPDHLMAFIHVLRQMGVGVRTTRNALVVTPPAGRPRGCQVVTLPYPAFPTDCQAQIMALAAVAEGTTVITERIFPDRFMAAAELKRMGANITVANGQAVVQGVDHLQGTEVMASDLRAGAALVLAGLAGRGQTVVHRIYHVDRGYEFFEERLRRLGAEIERFSEEAG